MYPLGYNIASFAPFLVLLSPFYTLSGLKKYINVNSQLTYTTFIKLIASYYATIKVCNRINRTINYCKLLCCNKAGIEPYKMVR